MKYKEITCVFCDEVGWVFVMKSKNKTKNFLTFGFSDDELYFDEPELAAKACARWIKKIAPKTTGYKIFAAPKPKKTLKSIFTAYRV